MQNMLCKSLSLTLSMLGKLSAIDILIFSQNISFDNLHELGDNLHEMSKPVSGKNIRKKKSIISLSSAEFARRVVKVTSEFAR